MSAEQRITGLCVSFMHFVAPHLIKGIVNVWLRRLSDRRCAADVSNVPDVLRLSNYFRKENKLFEARDSFGPAKYLV